MPRVITHYFIRTAMKIKWPFCWHEWAPWSKVLHEFSTVDLHQVKKCIKCNKITRRKAITVQINCADVNEALDE